jgi:hypothetical protein
MKDNFSGSGEVIALVICALNTVIVLAFLVNIWFGDAIRARMRREP